jgi:hypothetical protein
MRQKRERPTRPERVEPSSILQSASANDFLSPRDML